MSANRTYSFYHKDTGEFRAGFFSCPQQADVCGAIPSGHLPIEGRFDHLSQRIDTAARDKALNAARDAHPAKVDAARAAHEQAQFDARARHESSQDAQRKVRESAIADAIANNRPCPREFVLTPFVEQPFIAPVWDEAAELQKATLAAIVDYQPPQPSPDHEWHAESKRWRLTAEADHRNKVRAEAIARIAELEIKQARRVRELLSQNDPQLKAIDDEIKGLRANL